MKINEITIKNFRSHADTKIAGLGRLNILMGENGAGKSTALDAILYTLTGTCRGTDEGGRGSEILNTFGSGKEGVIVLSTDKGRLQRAVGQGPRSKEHLKIAKATGIPEQLARVLGQPTQFMRLKPAEQKDLLLSMMAATLTVEDVKEILGENAAKTEIEPLTCQDGIDALEERLRERRPQVKRDLSECVYVAQEKMPMTKNASEATLAEYGNAIAELERTLVKRRKDEAELAGRSGVLLKRQEELVQKAKAIDERFNDLGDPTVIEKAIKEAQTALAAAEKIEAERALKIAEINEQLSRAKANLEQLNSRAAKLAAVRGATCSTCTQPISASYKAQAQEEVRAEQERLTKGIKKATEQINALKQVPMGESASSLRSEVSVLQQSLIEAKQIVVRREEVLKELDSVEAEMLKPVAGLEGEPADEIEASLAAGRQAYSEMQYVLNERLRERQVKEKRAALEKELSWVEQMLEVVGPKGPLRAKLIGGGLSEFVAEVADLVTGLGLGKFSVQVEPWSIQVDGLPAVMLSESEQYRLSMAIAGVFAKRSGAGILCLDGADILCGDNAGLLIEVLERCGLDQAIVAASGEIRGCPPGWTMYSVFKSNGLSQVEMVLKEVAA